MVAYGVWSSRVLVVIVWICKLLTTKTAIFLIQTSLINISQQLHYLRTNYGKFSKVFRGSQLWNGLLRITSQSIFFKTALSNCFIIIV